MEYSQPLFQVPAGHHHHHLHLFPEPVEFHLSEKSVRVEGHHEN